MAIYAGQFGPEALEYPDGSHAILQRVTVLNSDGDQAILYNDRLKTAVAANPVSTDNLGNLLFYVVPGHYTCVVNGMEFKVQVGYDPEEPGSAIPDVRYLAYVHQQADLAMDWIVSSPLPFEPAACRVEYTGDAPGESRMVPFSYGANGTIVVHNGAPCRGTARFS